MRQTHARTGKARGMRLLTLQIGSCLAAAALVGMGATTGLAHPQEPGPTLDVGNPGPHELLTPGVMIIQGIAYDENAEHGVGVDRVSVFLGDRDEGGLFLGDATLGLPNPQSVEGGDPQFGLAGWRLRTPVLKGGARQLALTFYARSSVNGVETIESIPVIIGEDAGGGAGGEGGPEE
jgi:hypothetical protein